MADLIENNNVSYEAEIALTNAKKEKTLNNIETSSQIALYPLYGGAYENSDTIVLPITPSDLMFNEDSDINTIKLINYGELPVNMNRKLANWSITSFFPHRPTGVGKYSTSQRNGYETSTNQFKYWFDVSSGTEDPYSYYCDALLNWKNNQTPLVFMFNTWGNYYNCQIKKFSYGRKDAVGNVYYELDFQEYKEYTKFTSGSASTDYNSDTYYPSEGENILQVCKKIYGSSEYYQYFMTLNGLTTPDIYAGVAYKVR